MLFITKMVSNSMNTNGFLISFSWSSFSFLLDHLPLGSFSTPSWPYCQIIHHEGPVKSYIEVPWIWGMCSRRCFAGSTGAARIHWDGRVFPLRVVYAVWWALGLRPLWSKKTNTILRYISCTESLSDVCQWCDGKRGMKLDITRGKEVLEQFHSSGVIGRWEIDHAFEEGFELLFVRLPGHGSTSYDRHVLGVFLAVELVIAQEKFPQLGEVGLWWPCRGSFLLLLLLALRIITKRITLKILSISSM